MAISGRDVWRDYVTDGIPSSGNHAPRKGDIRSWANWLEQIITAFTSAGGLIYDTRALLYADLTKPANSMAWVIGDSTTAYNGVYKKVGGSGSGSWARVADLPYSFIVASDVGVGTANAIQATSDLPISGSALVLLNIFEANTGSPVTVSFNGGAPLTIKTNSGNDVAAGGLQSEMLVMGRVSGSTFRLVSDQVSTAIIAQAESLLADIMDRHLGPLADDAAATAAAGGFPTEGQLYFNTTDSFFRYWDGSAWQDIPYVTIADASLTAAKFPAAGDTVALPAIRRRLRAMPDLGDYGIFGGATDWGQDDFAAMESGVVADGHAKVFVPAGGNFRLGEQITLTRGLMLEGESKSHSVFSFFHNNSGFVITGANAAGGGFKHLSVCKGDSGNATAFIYLLASVDGTAPDFVTLEDVNMTGLAGGTASYPLLLDGQARTGVAPNGLVGLRNLILKDLDVFNATFTTIEIRACRALRMTGVNCFQGDGSANRVVMGGTSTNQTSVVSMQGCALGDVNLDWVNTLIGYPNYINNVIVSANASTNQIGRALGTVTNNSATTTVFT